MTAPLQIGIDARLLAYRSGGIAEYTRRLIEALAVQDRIDHYLILHAHRAGSDDRSLLPGPNFERVTCWTPPHHRLERSALAVEIAGLRLDVLHSPDFIPPRHLPFAGRIGAYYRRIITIHDLYFLHDPAVQTRASQRYYGDQIQAAVHDADHILAVSEATRTEIIERLQVPFKKITVQPEGVDPALRPLPADQIAAARVRLKLPGEYILCVGTIEPRKNIPGLLRAYRDLRLRLPDAPPLLIVGKRGWLSEDVNTQAAELGLADHVTWRQDITDSDRVAVYNGASVLAFPSLYEGFGLPALEAMACGIPVVVSDRGALRELVDDVGLLVDPADSEAIAYGMLRALVNTGWRLTATEKGLNRAAQYNWLHTAAIAQSVFAYVTR